MESQVVKIPKQPVNLKVREVISKVEEVVKNLPGHLKGNCYPLRHFFADGLYVRELTVPPMILTVTKIHKYAHPAFLLKGEVSVLEEGGIRHVKAPSFFITPAGTKRIIFHHTEVLLVTVHATKETDVDKIEEEIIASDFDNLPIIDMEKEKGEIAAFIKKVTKEEE